MREEDEANCLAGIFDVYFTIPYGIGREKAFEYLNERIEVERQQFTYQPLLKRFQLTRKTA